MTGAQQIAAAYLAVRAPLDQLKGDMAKVRDYFAAQVSSMSQAFGRVTLGAGVAGGGVLAAGLAKASSVAADFEQAMIEAGVSFDIFEQKGNDTFERLKELALQLGAATKYTATEAAQALTIFGQAGFTASEAMAALPETLKTAAANSVSIADAAELTTAVMRSMGKEAKDLAHVNDAMTVAASKSAAGFQDMQFSLRYVTPVAKQSKTSLEEVLAMVAKLADSGVKGELAGTAIRGIISDLSSPSNKAKQELESLGVSVENLGKKEGELFKIMEQLAAKNIDLATATRIVGVQQAGPLLSLLKNVDADGKKGVASLRALVAAMNDVNNVGIAGKKADALMGGTRGRQERLSSAVEALGVRVGEPLNKVLGPAIDSIIGQIDRLTEWVRINSTVFERWGEQVGSILSGVGNLMDRVWNKAFDADKAGGGLQKVLDGTESFVVDFDGHWSEFVNDLKLGQEQFAGLIDRTYDKIKDFFNLRGEIDTQEQLRLAHNEQLLKNLERQRNVLREQLEINQMIRNIDRDLKEAKKIGEQVDRDVKGMPQADAEGLRLIEMINNQKAWPALEAVRGMVPQFAGGNMWEQGKAGPMGMNLMGGGLGMVAMQQGVEKAVTKGTVKGQHVGFAQLHKSIQEGLVNREDKAIAKNQLRKQEEIAERAQEMVDNIKKLVEKPVMGLFGP